MTDIYLAFSGSGEAKKTLPRWNWEDEPLALLVSYDPAIFRQYKATKTSIQPRRTMLDSGAFTAWRRGAVIDMTELVEESKKECWDESVCLDVIGDPSKSLKNALAMKAMGSPAFPVFHIGEPLDLLREYCKEFGKVGVSCLFGEKRTDSWRFVERCFASCYPHKFHSFGWVAPDILRAYPFHSADASSWVTKTSAYGRWRAFGLSRLDTRGKGTMSVASEVRYYLRLEQELKLKWLNEMKRLCT